MAPNNTTQGYHLDTLSILSKLDRINELLNSLITAPPLTRPVTQAAPLPAPIPLPATCTTPLPVPSCKPVPPAAPFNQQDTRTSIPAPLHTTPAPRQSSSLTTPCLKPLHSFSCTSPPPKHTLVPPAPLQFSPPAPIHFNPPHHSNKTPATKLPLQAAPQAASIPTNHSTSQSISAHQQITPPAQAAPIHTTTLSRSTHFNPLTRPTPPHYKEKIDFVIPPLTKNIHDLTKDIVRILICPQPETQLKHQLHTLCLSSRDSLLSEVKAALSIYALMFKTSILLNAETPATIQVLFHEFGDILRDEIPPEPPPVNSCKLSPMNNSRTSFLEDGVSDAGNQALSCLESLQPHLGRGKKRLHINRKVHGCTSPNYVLFLVSFLL